MDVTFVAHTHWDREWYRTFQQFRYDLVRLVDQVLDILQADPAYCCFMLDGQTIVLDDYLAVRPERESDLRELVQAGRLLIGPWHALPDEFLVSGEALVRNFQLGSRTAARFGGRMPVGYTPDPFGHISQLPQILHGVGIDTAVFRRGLADEPTLLWWEAPDGSRVFTVYLRDSYDNAGWLPDDPQLFPRHLKRLVESLAPHTPISHVLLMYGADHKFPVAALPRLLQVARQALPDMRLHQGSLSTYIADVRKVSDDLPVVCGELDTPKRHHLLPGVWSARMWVKQRNSAAQVSLERYAEPLAAFARVWGGPQRQAQLWMAWRLLIQNHAHDSICGCSVDQVHEEMRPRFDQAEQVADLVSQESLTYLARQLDVQPLLDATPSCPRPQAHHIDFSAPWPVGWTVAVYNPVPDSTSAPVKVEVPVLPPGYTYRVFDARGRDVAWELIQRPEMELDRWTVPGGDMPALLAELANSAVRGRAVRWSQFLRLGEEAELWLEWGEQDVVGHSRLVDRLSESLAKHPIRQCQVRTWAGGRVWLRFQATDSPGLGLDVYFVHPWPGQPNLETKAALAEPEIENEFFCLTAATDGTLTLLDKRTGRRFPGLNRFVDGGDRGDEYNFCPPVRDRIVGSPAEAPVVTAFDAGLRGQCLEVQQVYHLPARLKRDRQSRSDGTVPVQIVSRAWLRSGTPRLDIETTVDNKSEDHRLRVHFPTGLVASHTLAESAFDLVSRSFNRPPDTTGWIEQPVTTQPQQSFVLAEEEGQGFLLANRGLPEVEAIRSEDGRVTFALTLLRCIGWLSRDDFPCRVGQAGPQMVTPGAQMSGQCHFHYAVVPYTERWAAVAQAHGFNAPPMAVAVPGKSGPLSPGQPWLTVEPTGFLITTIKPEENGKGLILRGFNATEEPLVVTLQATWPIGAAQQVNLLEESRETLLVESGSIRVSAKSKQIISVALA
ncbi:MAG: glycoside hydrolase family 38 C-terminal domain-containing protein [Chloroflexota bacterium]|nr:glycoside hydrolase family 38 C-terminal domain-containing protein [Chloroflexota bacterium]